MKTINLECKCGATFAYIDSEDSFSGDKAPFRFQIEVIADKWLERHQACIAVPEYQAKAVQS
jgi:hypothetical protein